MEGIAINNPREIDIRERHERDSKQHLPARPPGTKEQQTSTHSSDVQAHTVEGVRQEPAKRGENKYQVGDHSESLGGKRAYPHEKGRLSAALLHCKGGCCGRSHKVEGFSARNVRPYPALRPLQSGEEGRCR